LGEGGVILIAVRARPEGGKASEAARDALAEALGIAKTRLRLVRGATARAKLFEIEA
jgi:uncharacterized protein YggU (UPF0235/DUF167 family)